MRDKRVVPALKSGAIDESDLVSIIREAEEYGHQHVLAYQTTNVYVNQVVNEDTMAKSLKKLGREDLLKQPVIVGEPHALTLVDVRIDNTAHTAQGRTLTLKGVETVSFLRPVGTTEEDHGRFVIKRFERTRKRVIHVLSVHDDGFAEMRLTEYDTSASYADKAAELWDFFAPFVDKFKFDQLSVTKAQNKFWRERDKFKGIIKYGDSRVRDLSGNTASFASGGETKDLFDAPNAQAGFDAFYGDEGTCDRSNFWFTPVKGENGTIPSRDVHVRFAGAVNEFVIPVACDRADYEYALGKIRSNNG